MFLAKEKVFIGDMKVFKKRDLNITLIISWLYWLQRVVYSQESRFCYDLKLIDK